jgi:hypothetical protein
MIQRFKNRKLASIILLGVILTSFALSGCSKEKPEITAEQISTDIIGIETEDINLKYHFLEAPLEIRILESKYEVDKALITALMHTRYEGMSIYERKGRVLLHYEWDDGKWNLVRLENISLNIVNIQER